MRRVQRAKTGIESNSFGANGGGESFAAQPGKGCRVVLESNLVVSGARVTRVVPKRSQAINARQSLHKPFGAGSATSVRRFQIQPLRNDGGGLEFRQGVR